MIEYLQYLPVVMMIASFLAGGTYIYDGQIGAGLYWFAAGFLNFSVIFLIPKGI